MQRILEDWHAISLRRAAGAEVQLSRAFARSTFLPRRQVLWGSLASDAHQGIAGKQETHEDKEAG